MNMGHECIYVLVLVVGEWIWRGVTRRRMHAVSTSDGSNALDEICAVMYSERWDVVGDIF
jgi:hypothetical protein